MLMNFIIKRNLIYTNKEILKILNVLIQYYNIKSFNFILDNENNLYFYLNDNDKILFYNHKNINYELLSYLYKYQYFININLININNTNIKLNEIEIIYINKLNNNENEYIKTIKEKLKDSLKE